MNQKEILIKSTLDGTLQPSLFYRARKSQRPLLVGLHTWSFDRFNQIENMLPYAEKYDFNLLLPEFRGANLKTNEDCTYAKRDIQDAIDYVVETEDVDKNNIFLLGLSGGGHMALLMAGSIPAYFKAIGAYVPITDLKKWTHIPKIVVAVATEEQIADIENCTHFYDTEAYEKYGMYNAYILVQVPAPIEGFRFEALTEKGAGYSREVLYETNLTPDQPVIIHTYINDVIPNRGYSYLNENGVRKYSELSTSMK